MLRDEVGNRTGLLRERSEVPGLDGALPCAGACAEFCDLKADLDVAQRRGNPVGDIQDPDIVAPRCAQLTVVNRRALEPTRDDSCAPLSALAALRPRFTIAGAALSGVDLVGGVLAGGVCVR